MKKIILVLSVMFITLLALNSNAQTKDVSYTVIYHEDAGNPGGLNTNFDGYGMQAMITGGNQPVNFWSDAQDIPFDFEFFGSAVTQLKVSQNGLITFDMSASGTPPNDNSSLPAASLPDNTIAGFWDNFTNNPPTGSNDCVYKSTFGTAPHRQFWIHYHSLTYASYIVAYFAIVLEETTNKIYMVDCNYSNGSGSSTVGVQKDNITAFQFSGSPNVSFNYSPYSPGIVDNDYYEFIGADLEFPTVEIISPNGGENLEVSEWHTISWIAGDDVEVVGDSIYYSTNSGQDWTLICSQTGNPQSYSWLVPDTPSDECLIKIIVYDIDGNCTEAISAGTFVIGYFAQQFVNGGFETGDFSEWTVTGIHSASVEEISYQGRNCGHIYINTCQASNSNTPTNLWKLVGQTVYIPEIADSLEFYMSVVAPDGYGNWHNGGSVWIMDADSVGTYTCLFQTGGGAGSAACYPWEFHRVNIEAWAGRIATIYFAGHNSNGMNDHLYNIYFDEVRVSLPTIIDEIPPTVTLNFLNGGEELMVGETYNIQWDADDDTGIETDMVYYSTNNGADWNRIFSYTGNFQACEWTVPDIPSTECLIKVVVYDGGNNSAIDISDVPFTIVENPNVVFLNGGFETGDFTNWTVSGPHHANVIQNYGSFSGHIRIAVGNVSGGAPPNDNWQLVGQSIFIPESADSLNFYMRLTANAWTGDYHSGGSVWILDEDTGVYTQLYNTGGGGGPGTGTVYPWEYHQINIEAWAGHQATIYFAGHNSVVYNDHQCDIYFDRVSLSLADIIPPTVEVNSPNGGEVWEVGETYQIQWTADDDLGIYSGEIFYSTYNGATWTLIDSVTGNPQTYDWVIPNTTSEFCMVKVVVRDGGNNSAEDVSDTVFTIDTEIGIDEPNIPEITKSRLYQNYPNPFDTETTITFSLPENTENTELTIYNIKGQKVMTLINKKLSAGKHSIIWKRNDKNNKQVSTGIYYYKIKTGRFTSTKKMLFLN